MKKRLTLFVFLISLTCVGQIFNPPQGASDRIFTNLGGQVIDSAFVVPVQSNDNLYPLLPMKARIRLNAENNVFESHNGDYWVTHAVPSKSDFSTNTFVGLNAGLDNTYLSSTQGAQNTFIGTEAGRNNTTGYAETYLGYGAGYNNTTGLGNVFLGYQSGYENITNSYNTAAGTDAAYRNRGDRNNFFGHHCGKGPLVGNYITGSDNCFFGWENASYTTTGSFNSFFGNRAGMSHTTGSHNVAVGYLAGFGLTTGSMNTFIGREAGQAITTQNNNVFNGYRAGYNCTSSGNTAVGFSVVFNLTTGSGNTAFGSGAGDDIITGSNNTFIGLNAGNNASQSTSANFSTAIGYNSHTTKSNQMVLGSTNVTETLVRGTVLVNTATDNAGGAKLQVNGRTTGDNAINNNEYVPLGQMQDSIAASIDDIVVGSGLRNAAGTIKLGSVYGAPVDGFITDDTWLIRAVNPANGFTLDSWYDDIDHDNSTGRLERNVEIQYGEEQGSWHRASVGYEDEQLTYRSTSGIGTPAGRSQITFDTALSGIIITDEIYQKGAEYEADYSANYTSRSIPDVGWVEDQLTNITLDAVLENGSTASITDPVDISAASINLDATAPGGYITMASPSAYIFMDSFGPGVYFQMLSGASYVVAGESNFEGIKYGIDFSANYDERSLPDVEWVQNYTAGGQVSFNSTTTALDSAALNAQYADVGPGHRVICKDIVAGPIVYTKAEEVGTSDIWLEDTQSIVP